MFICHSFLRCQPELRQLFLRSGHIAVTHHPCRFRRLAEQSFPTSRDPEGRRHPSFRALNFSVRARLAVCSVIDGSIFRERSHLADERILNSGSRCLGVSTESFLWKSAKAGRLRQHARRARYP